MTPDPSGTARTTWSSARCREALGVVTSREAVRRQQPRRGPRLVVVHQPDRRSPGRPRASCARRVHARTSCSIPMHAPDAARGSSTRARRADRPPASASNIPGKGKYLFKVDDADAPERPSAAQTIGGEASTTRPATTPRASRSSTSARRCSSSSPASGEAATSATSSRSTRRRSTAASRTSEQARHAPADAGVRVDARLHARRLPLRGHAHGRSRTTSCPTRTAASSGACALLAAWLDHFDAATGNTIDTWITRREGRRPGRVAGPRRALPARHERRPSARSGTGTRSRSRLGYSYVLDWGDIGGDFVTLRRAPRALGHACTVAGHETFGYSDVADFDPTAGRTSTPNPAFNRMTERDGAWMARILARFTPEMVRRLAEMARFADPLEHGRTSSERARGRLAKILERYLTRLSPIADVHARRARARLRRRSGRVATPARAPGVSVLGAASWAAPG